MTVCLHKISCTQTSGNFRRKIHPSIQHQGYLQSTMRYTPFLRSVQVLVRSHKGNPTGITGISQHPNPRPALIEIYRATLELLHDEFPDNSVYKKSTFNFTQKRLEIVEQHEDVAAIEEKIGNGLIEEVLIQASDEFDLANQIKEWKVWDELEEKPLEDQWVYFGKKV